jgi:hypothetical protein
MAPSRSTLRSSLLPAYPSGESVCIHPYCSPWRQTSCVQCRRSPLGQAPPFERPPSPYPRGPGSGPGYHVPAHHHLLGPIRPTRRHTATSPPRDLYAVPTLCGSAPATREWFRALACCSFLSCRPLGPRGVHGRLSSSPPAAALAFAIGGTARHSQYLYHPLQVEEGFRGFPVRFRYDLTGCSPPFGGTDQALLQGRFMTRRSYAMSMKCLRQAPLQLA